MDWKTDRIGSAQRGENPTVLTSMKSGYAVIGDVQFLPGYTLLLCHDSSTKSLSSLTREKRVQFLKDLDLVAMAVEKSCRIVDSHFRRVNIEILGNMDEYLHAHVFPRYDWESGDMRFRPVWHYDPQRWNDPEASLSSEQDTLRSLIKKELCHLMDMER